MKMVVLLVLLTCVNDKFQGVSTGCRVLICLCCWVSIDDYLGFMIGWTSVIPTKYLFLFTITYPYGKSCFVSNGENGGMGFHYETHYGF